MSATPRIHVAPDLVAGGTITIDGDQAHYLTRVMRLGAGDAVRVFNGRDGEFDGEIAEATKAAVRLSLGNQTRTQQAPPNLWLLFAPLKKDRTDFVIEKAVELGVAEIRPVLTERTNSENVRVDRLARLAVEAAEQTERLDVPPVREAQKLFAELHSWPADRTLIFADEAGDDTGRPWGGESGRAMPLAATPRRPRWSAVPAPW